MHDQQTYLAFVWATTGYELREQHGELPLIGETVEANGTEYTVLKIAPSPLPNDRRACVYLQG